MNIIKNTFIALLAVSMIGVVASQAEAQNSNEGRRAAVQAYNQASDLAKKGEYDASIAKFEEAIELAQSIGEEGADIVKLSREKIPGIYYDKAISEYRAFQNNQTASQLDATIAAFEEAAEAGEQYGNQSVVQKSTNNATKLTYAKSQLQYRQGNYEAAMETINRVIDNNPNYATAYYHKGLIYKKMDGNFDNALEALDQAIKVAEENDNAQIARQARENASGELVYRANQRIQQENYSTAIEMLNRALEYNPESATAYVKLAEAYNNRADWDQALTNAQKALELETGGRSAQAAIYFQIGTAQKGLGNYSEACDAYAKAAYGRYRANAQHQMEYELKCSDQ